MNAQRRRDAEIRGGGSASDRQDVYSLDDGESIE
jgi:hypothetical protein